MVFKVVGTFKSALSRQISEAVRIRGRGPLALDSKSEYGRCKIHRLTIGKEEEYQKGGEQLLDGTQGEQLLNGTQGEHYNLMERRRQMDRNNYDGTRLSTTLSQKRGNTYNLEHGRKSKERNLYLLGNNGRTRTETLDLTANRRK